MIKQFFALTKQAIAAVLIPLLAFSGVPFSLQADTLYKTNSGLLSVLNTQNTTLAAPAGIIQNYAEGTTFTAADIIVFNNLITAASTFRVSNTTATNLAVGGLTVGSLFNGAILNPGGAITIQNGPGATGAPVTNTITLGASGIDMSLAAQNLTFSQDTGIVGNSLTIATGANQTWINRTGRTISLAAAPFTLSNNLTLQGAGTTTFGAGAVGPPVVTTGPISGAGNLLITGSQSGGATIVNLDGTNTGWTGAVTVGDGATHLRLGGTLNLNQTTVSQNKLADGQTLTINNSSVVLLGTGGGTETVAAVALGRGLNVINRTAGTGVLQANAITFGTGAALNVGNIGTVAASSWLTTDNLNNNLILGGRAVAINGTTDTNWVKNATGAADGAVIAASGADYTTNNALDTWTTVTQNILMNATGTASTASRTINSLKIAHATPATVVTTDIGTGNTLTINDGFNGGGIIRNQNGATTIGGATVGVGSLTAGGVDDSVNDTLYLWNSQNTMNIFNVIKDNNTGVGSDTLHLFSGGAGTVTVHANNTYTGGTTIGAGTLAIGANTAGSDDADLGSGTIVNHGTLILSKQAAATLAQQTIANNITGTGAFTINRGTATLSGVNDYSGLTTVSTATTLRAGSTTGISANSRMILNAATAVLDLNGFDSSVAALRGDQTTANVNLGTNTLTLSGSDLANSGGAEILSLAGVQNYQGAFSATAGNLIKNGAYTQVFTAGGTAAYTGTTTVNAGVLQTNKALATSGVTVNNTATATTLGGFSTFVSNIANSTAATTSVTLANAGSTWQINAGFNQSVGALSGVTDSRITLGNAATNLTTTAAVGTTFAGVISGAGSFTKDGVGALVLTGGNSYTGATTITGGTVQIGAANAVQVISDRSAVVIGATGILNLNGNAETIGSLAGVAGASVLMGAGTLTVGLDNTNTNYAGTTSAGTGGLTKLGTGIQTLSGANTFTGAVNIGNLGGQTGGGLTLGTGGSLADTVNVRITGNGTSFAVNASDTVGAVTGTRNSTLALGVGATLTSTYTNTVGAAGSATADTDSTAGRIVRLDGSIANPQVGMLVSGTSIPLGSYIVQVLDSNHVLLNAQPTPTTTNTALTPTTVSVLNSAITGAGGFTKNGTGLLILTGNSTHTGATTINDGTVQIGGIWNGQKFSLHDTLSDSSALVFGSTGTQTLNFANSTTNLASFERIGSLAGGNASGTNTTINLTSGSNVAVLAFGGNNTSTTYSGNFLPASSAGTLIKEGTGTFIWANPTDNTYDGIFEIRGGGLTSANQGLDGATVVRMENSAGTLATTFTSGVNDTFAILEGGAGVSRIQPNTNMVGALYGNYVSGVAPSVVISPATVMTVSSTTSSGFNGVISGAGGLTKAGTSTWQTYGANTYLGETNANAGTLTLGVLSRSAGVGAVSGSDIRGSLADTGVLNITGGTFNLNGLTETIGLIRNSAGAGTLALVNGTLTASAQTTQIVSSTITGNRNAVLNLNAASAATLTLTSASSGGYAGTVNVGTNAAVTLGTGSNFGDLARINLNGTGTQFTLAVSDNIGSVAGTGNIVLTGSLGLLQAESGTSSSTAFSGATSGGGALNLSTFGGLTISGNLAHTGGITLSNGSSLNLNYGTGNNIIPTTGALTLNGGTIRVISSDTTSGVLESAASTSLNAGASSVEALNSRSGNPGTGVDAINLGTITRAAGGTIDLGRKAAATGNANVNGILGAYATQDGNSWAVSNGVGAATTGLVAYSSNTFGAGLHVDITAAGANAGGLADTLRFSAANAASITGATTIATGGILLRASVGANTSTISGALNATGNELIIHQYNTQGDLILSNVAGTNTAITTAGGGRTQITNNIAGTGVTTVGYGYLQLGDNTVGGSATGMVGSGNILNDGTIGINRSNPVTLGGIISGAGNLEQRGSGTTTLSGLNTYLGRTTVLGGTLEVTNNAGLGGTNFGLPNRWANLTSVNTGGTLLLNVAGGGAITELLNLDGGTLDLRSAVATTLAAPIVLTSDSTINVSNTGAAVSHIISGEIYALPGADLTVGGVVNGTPSTLVLAPAATTGARWENTTINANGRLQIGNASRGFLGTGTVTNNGTLIINPNDAHYVVGNTITGAGTLAITRGGSNGNTYLTGDLSGFTGTLLVSSPSGINNSGLLELANDTYSPAINSAATINITANAFAGTSGVATLRTHYNQDVTLSNTISLTPANDGTNAKSAQFTRAGLGNVTLDGTINLGLTNAGTGTQRNVIQSDAGGKLLLNATLVGAGASNLLNIVNSSIVVVGGSASNTYSGILSGNSVWVFNNSGTTTLSGANTFDSGNNYFRQGTINLTGGAALADNTDIHVLGTTVLNINASETIGQVHSQRGSTINIAGGQTLTIDDNATQLIAGAITGAGNLSIGANTDNQTAYIALYGTNTASGNLVIGGTGGTTGRFGGIQTTNLTNAIGSFATVTLGTSTGSGGFIDYVGSGQTYAGNISLAGTGTNSITANGTGALILSGNLTATANNTLGLRGQTGGYFNPIVNRVDGAITEGAGVLSILMGSTTDDDRFGISGRWALTNANNDFSGAVTVNVGMLELAGNLGDGSEATSVLGDTNAIRTITLGSNNFNGRRYDMLGNTDQLGDQGFNQGTNRLDPLGDVGTIIFNDTTGAGTVTFGTNISWSMVNTTAANTTGAQLINNGTKNIIINGTFATNSTGTHNIVLDGSNTLSNQLNSALANPATSQVTAVIKEGAGTWRLGGINTYTGATTINNGILELAGGAAIVDSATVALSADGGDGLYSGTAMLRIVGSETFANLTGDIGTEVQILSGQTLTLRNGATNPYSGVISNAGNLTTNITGATGFTLTLANKNTYTGITTLGASSLATGNNGITLYHLADGGVASGIGAGTAAATDLVFTTNTAGTNGGILTWSGYTNQSTDRLFTMGLGVAGARINAAGTVVGTTAPTMTFSGTGAIAFTGAGARTLTLGGGTISDNTFRPQITDQAPVTGMTSLIKTDAGLWFINPDVAGNTYTGGTSITGGTLAIQAGNALGSGTITINGAGVGLEIRGAGITLANNITNVVDNGALTVSSGTNVASGTNTLTAGNLRLAVLSGASLELSNAATALTGIGGLWKLGQGNLIISGTNAQTTATGVAILSGGLTRLEYGTNNTSKLNDLAALTMGWNGAGGLTIPGNNPGVPGQTYIIHQSGATLDLSNGSHTEQVLSTTFGIGANYITRSGVSTATINLENITRANTVGSTLDVGTASIATTNNLNGTGGILNTTGGAAGTATGAFATVAKTGWATTAGAGTDIAITALGAAGYNNALLIETFGAGFNTDIISAAAASAAATTNTLRFNVNQASTLTLSGLLQLQSSGLLVTPTVGAFNTIITGGQIQNAANTVSLEALIVHQHNTAGALQIDSVIQNNTNAQGLTKSGAGKLFLGGLNTFTGAINLNEGEIQVGGTAAVPGTATNAYLSGVLATPAANANAGINLSEGTTLRFRTTNTTVYNSGVVAGSGAIIMDTGNLMPLLLDDDNGNYHGNITVNQGTLQVAGNNNALGSNRGITTIGSLGTLQMNANQNSGELITYLQGATVTTLAASNATLSGKQTLSNSTAAGMNYNITAPTTAGTVGLNISGVVYGSNGFTKTGNGILQLSANNFTDVYDGYTTLAAANTRTPSLSGQIKVNAGILYVGNARALGAHGAGNEVIVASGASLDLRGAALNYGDDSDLTRKFIEISGNGFVNAQGNATGALRNTSGTGIIVDLKLNGSSTINTGGQINASALNIATFDNNLSNANSLTGAFTRNRPVIAGGGFDLTIQGGRIATDNFVISDPTFSSALGNLIIREGGSRFRHEVTAALPSLGLSGVTDITGVLEIGYGGPTAADLTGAQVGGQGNTVSILGANVGARFLFENSYATHHTVDITMNGALAASAVTGNPGGARSLAGGHNYLQVDFATIPDGTTYLDGALNLTGTANRNLIVNDSVGNYTVQEQGNLVVAPATKLVFGGVAQGLGGFTKQGVGDVRFTNANTFSGDVNVVRFGFSAAPWESHTYKINGVDYATNGLGEGWAEYSLTLNGANGAFTDVGNINLERRGMLTLDNTTRLAATSGVAGGNNNNRIADDAVINLNHGWLRLNAGTVTNTEVLGTVNVNAGSNILDLYGTDGAGVATDLTITTLNRAVGGTLRITNLDATSTFSTAAVGDSARVTVGTLGAGAALSGGGGAANTSTMSIAQGIFGGNAPIDLTTDLRVLGFNGGNVSDLWNQQRNIQFATGSHFMTMESGFLRPLDNDEYFTAPTGVINATTLGNTNQNVNLSDVNTIVSQDSTINSLRLGALTDHDGTGATGLVDHHAINLYVDGTLKINSGMISSAYWTVGNTSSAGTFIIGGALDFNGKEAIINNQNAFYRLTDGTIQGGDLDIRSAITNADGLTKTGFQRVNLFGANTYTGLTTVSEGILDGRHGRYSFGVGGAGNGIVVTGTGELRTNSGIRVGTAAAREDIYVGSHSFEGAQVMRVESDLTQWFSNVTIDNVDASGQTVFTPRIRTDNSATSIIMGDIAGGDTAISNDVLAIDSRVVQFDSTGNNVFIMRGQFGDRYVGGVAAPIADPISLLPTLAGTRTNENEVLRVTLAGGSDETNLILDRNYNAAGRLTIARGTLIANYDPAAADGTGFWTAAAISKIPNADSTTTTFNINGGTTQQGFVLGTSGNTYGAILLARPNQVFNMASWTMAGTGAKFIGGINESGTVTFGNGTGSLTTAGQTPNLYAADGGTVVFNQRMTGNVGTAPSNFGFLKAGRGQVTLQNTALAAASDSSFVLGGGTLVLNHTGATVQALVGNQNARFDGGTLISTASSAANTATNFATDTADNRVLNFSIGGTEIVARTVNTGVARNMTINMGNAGANANTTNFTRGLGATANLVEDQAAGGTAQITLQFNASSTAAVKNQAIAWATYGTLSRTATDFAMSDLGAGNDVRAYGRALDEFNNNVATWATGQDVSENGGSGFTGSLAAPLSVSTIRFDANADSVVNLGTSVLTVAGSGLLSSGGAILVSSNVGSANKTITGGAGAGLTTSGGRSELIVHHYGTGNLNLDVAITGGINLTIAGPSTTNAATIGTTGAVVLNGANTYTGKTFLNGSVLSIESTSRLGANPGVYAADQLTFNGGTLRYTGSGMTQLGSNYGVTFNGNGGTIDVTDGAGEFRIFNDLNSSAQYRGDLIKVGAGTLSLAGGGDTNNPLFLGLIDVRQGTLRLNGLTTGAAGTSTIMGSNTSYLDGTIFRTGTNLAIQMGNGNDTSEWTFDEWLTFEGNNYVSAGTINTQTGNVSAAPGFADPNNERTVNLNGVNTINGTVTFDVVGSQNLRLNNSNGYLTGNGTIIKDGGGTLLMATNNPDYTGAITILQGRVTASGQADVLGTGYTVANGSKVITLGSDSRQGIAELTISSDNVHGATAELNHAVNVVYNPAQAKRLLFETFANGSQIEVNGNITLNDNLNLYINDTAETGGSVNYVNINSQLLDGATTSGNLIFTSEDNGGANDSTNGRVNNYLVLKNNNSGWTGDIRVSHDTSFDQDDNAILRLEHVNALGVANDVDMGFNSILQTGGGARTIGALSTNGGTGPFLGDTAGGTMGASSNGVSVIIENADTTAGTLTITQSTPAAVETVWNAYFRNGSLNSEFFAPGVKPVASAALNIVKAGDGWATIATDNAYTGTTTVTGGILQVGRSGVGDTGTATAQALSAPQFVSDLGTTVAGTGVIQGATLINGSLRPGDEAGSVMGTLIVNGSLTLGATSVTTLQTQRASYTAMNVIGIHDAAYATWNVAAASGADPIYGHLLNDPVTTAQHDKLLITGGLTITTGGKFALSNLGYNPTEGDIFNLVDWTGGGTLGLTNLGGIAQNGGLFRTGAEAGTDIDLFELGSGYRWDVSQFNTTGVLIVARAETREFDWNGDQGTNWTTPVSNTNWLDAPVGEEIRSLPTMTDDVYFTANSVTGGSFNTTLGGTDFAVNNLIFGTGANNTTPSSIDTGTDTLTIYGGINQIAGSAANEVAGSGAGGVVLAQSQTWTNNSVNALTVSAPVSGTADLTKAGTGTLILSDDNTYTGITTITGGTLQVGAGGTTGTLGADDVVNNANLVFNRSNLLPVANDLSGSGNVSQSGTGTTVLSGVNTYAGVTTVNAGTLQFALQVSLYNNTPANWTAANFVVNSGATGAFNVGGVGEFTAADIDQIKVLGTGTGGFRGGSTLGLDTTNAGGSFTYNSVIGDTNGGVNSVGFTKLGAGTLVSNANHTYTGATIVRGGTFQVGDGGASGSLETSSITVEAGATLALNRNDTVTQSNASQALNNVVISGAGGFTQAGTAGSKVILDKVNTYSGATIVSEGTLIVNGSIASSSMTTVESGGTLGGNGTVGAVTFEVGSTVSPGNSIDTLNVGNTIWNGGNYDFEFSTNGATGAAGTQWDLLNIAGTLDFNGASSGGITMNLITMVNTTTQGPLATWDPLQNSIWAGIVQTTGGISGFSSDKFIFDTAPPGGNFQNPMNGAMSFFTVVQNGNNLDLVYSAVPEPGTAGALLMGLFWMVFRRGRRQLTTVAEVASS